MIDDIEELKSVVAKLEGTTDDRWVPVWQRAGERHEHRGDELAATGEHHGAQNAYLQAKTYYAIGRFPRELTPAKQAISDACARAYEKACAYLHPPLEIVDVEHQGQTIRTHFRAPVSNVPAAGVLIMCGADVFKEDRGWAQQMCLDNGMASLVMDGPGTGGNPFPWEPASVTAWEAALDYLAERPEVDADCIGAFGISRGGYSVMQLAGTVPGKVSAVVANAGHPFGYEMTSDELDAFVAARNKRATWKFGGPQDPPSFPEWSRDIEQEIFDKWSLSALGVVDNITMPVLMINGKHDHLAPIGNIYYMLEHGPAANKTARIYADDGHCAFKHFDDWAPACFEWLADKLMA